MIRPSRLTLLLIAAPLVVVGCKKKPVVVAPTPIATEARGTGAGSPRPSGTATPTPVDNANADIARINQVRATLLETIYFEYDMDELRDDARALLDAKLPWLNLNKQIRFRIAGHSDERGSDEYNIALGRRRAETTKRYLTDRGSDASRIETTSFGRERPAVQGTTEDAWAKNRRAEFEITAGGDQLRARLCTWAVMC